MVDLTLTTELDPVEGLVSYTNFVKPYHTKILEVLVEYIHTDCIDVTFTEDWYLSLGMPAVELLPFWGWSVEEAERFFRGDYQKFQISEVNSGSGYFEVVGDASDLFAGSPATLSKILVQTSDLQFQSFTVTNTSVTLTPCTVNDPYYGATIDSPEVPAFTTGTKQRTKVYVSEAISSSITTGVIVPQDSMSQEVGGATWQSKGGLVFPSNIHIDKNINCGGYGSIFQQTGSPPPSLPDGLDTPNQILGVSTTPMYFEIDNNGYPGAVGSPNSSWARFFNYGTHFTVTGSSGNDNDRYTVFHATTVYGSPATTGSPEVLRIYTLENIPSNVADGTLQLRPWGYDEPHVCVDQGQSLSANPYFAENMSFTINDNNTNFVQGWDMDLYDMDGYDGGPFTYQVVFT